MAVKQIKVPAGTRVLLVGPKKAAKKRVKKAAKKRKRTTKKRAKKTTKRRVRRARR